MKDQPGLDRSSLRSRQSRLAHRMGGQFYDIAMAISAVAVLGAAVVYVLSQQTPLHRAAYLAGAMGLVGFMLAQWYRGDLSKLRPTGTTLDGILAGDLLGLLPATGQLTPQATWHATKGHWQAQFITTHLLLRDDEAEAQLSNSATDMDAVWADAKVLAAAGQSQAIEAGHVAAALLRTSPNMQSILSRLKSSTEDVGQVAAWLDRLVAATRAPKPYFGGIGRDWANGFTPLLNQFGENVSLSIEHYGAHFGWLTTSAGVQGMRHALSQGASAIALVGNPGIGKTSHAYALAQSLLQEDHDPNLEHRQIVSLNPSLMLSSARQQGELEYIVVSLLREAAHAGHVMLFFDNAQLFFTNGVGSFDMTKVLLPVLQGRQLQMIFAMTPQEYQQLKATNAAFAGLLTPVILAEPSESDVMRVLEDSSTSLEIRQHLLIPFDSLREIYRLSGRYEQDIAYPGKATRLLEQTVGYAENGIVTVSAVQRAVEQSKGVKVGTAKPAEADQLLHLEDAIHKRMINQSRAVSVVSNALRRARAGVSDPKRPIGSFLFLGPTGVGKTELARSIAATYFGNESNMIRLDMSEYQQPSDVSRLLSNGSGEQASLIMAVRKVPFSVVLLDEIEKAHPNILNLLLQLLDEGQLTDSAGRPASFKDAIIIATSNAGANTIREHVERGEELESFEKQFIDELISSNQFKPELLNRFDEIVLFRPLKPEELAQLVTLMLGEVNKTLANQNISVELTPAATKKIAEAGYDPRLGARPLRRELQRTVEDTIAARILTNQTRPGDHVTLDLSDLKLS